MHQHGKKSLPAMPEIMVSMMNDKKPEKTKNDALEMHESPWLKNQVETHLVYRPENESSRR